ncbi:N-acetylated-alpha-linked acidic dipeptidase 2-like [Glandiceps talaboti]
MYAKESSNRCTWFIAIAVTLVLGFVLGILIGYFGISRDVDSKCGAACEQPVADKIFNDLVAEMKAPSIEKYLQRLTSTPHLAGTPADLINAEYVRDEWVSQGLDSANIYSYNVLLSYPDPDQDNTVQLLNENGDVNFTCSIKEKGLRPEDDAENIVNPFNAYSGQGNITGDLVYVNYGRVEDFDKLEELGVNLTGKILIARYGKIFRGNKALSAEQNGAIGLIIYSDPADYAVGGVTDDEVYPNDWWLPGTGAQRGNLHVSDHKGDPLTPGYPANDYAYRTTVEDSPLPSIPVHPIGYGDAKMFLRELGDSVSLPDEWAGGISGIDYNIGPGFKESNRRVRMDIHTNNQRKNTYNVIGFIRGAVEPDRYILLGNHRDAWVFGAVDPSSGTAVMLELTKAFGKLVKGGWRPRRSIVFCSWGAEEYGLIGSSEWVEEFAKNLGARSVAYLNVDSATSGNFVLAVKSSPLLYQTIYRATKKVESPKDATKTLFDAWSERTSLNDDELPSIRNMGSGSDFAPFAYQLGIPAADMRYTYNSSLGISSYPVYHSVYETFYLVKQFIDPDFTASLAVARLWAEVARDLSESVIIPFDCKDYAKQLKDAVANLKDAYETNMASKGITFGALDSAVENFTESADSFHTSITEMTLDNALKIRQVNDQLMNVERAFIDPLGLPNRKFLRHVVYAPSSTNYYAGSAFPGIIDAMYKIDEAESSQWEVVKQQMAVIAFTIQSAATVMMDIAM